MIAERLPKLHVSQRLESRDQQYGGLWVNRFLNARCDLSVIDPTIPAT